ncbi:hypothetical protein C7H19_10025 [Aphanothece hegewaldii CCALA 016]|uniref:Uncharacterized protein n=2 Tax=Aphanothece TaxID=1121 RepID=A0A2T1LYN1_9CHRO|nr:hypothetical protein C7H19_10025 [Aphanothece hegewaldii CCALA 016]
MSEEDILRIIEEYCQETGIYFQVFLQVPYLYVYINREAAQLVDYNQLSEKMISAIAHQQIPELQGISLHSRILGTIEPDWETYLELPSVENNVIELENESLPVVYDLEPQETILTESSSEPILKETPETILTESSSEPILKETPETIVNESSSEPILEETQPTSEPFELAKYCFIRNRSLLTAKLPHPSANIAKMVDFFHVLPNKQIIAPFLDDIFNKGKTPNTTNHPPSVQQWVKELVELDEEKKRKTSIWFSRYCINPTATMEQVTAVLSIATETSTPTKTEETEPEKTTEKTEPSLLTPSKYNPPTSSPQQPTQKVTGSRLKKTATKKKAPTWQPSSVHLAIAWVIFTIFVVMINVRTMSTALETSPLCENSPSSDQCELAVQIASAPAIELAFKRHPGTPSERTKAAAEFEGVTADVYTPPAGLEATAIGTCQFYASLNAGLSYKEIIKMKTTPLSTDGTIVLPGVYFVDVQQNNFKGGSEPIRTACVFQYTETKQKVNVNTLAKEVIPTKWPEVAYEKTSKSIAIQKTVGVFSILSVLGTGTLFTAIGLFVASVLGLGIRAYSLEAIFKASFFLGIIELLLSFLPSLFIARIALETLALSLTSAVVKDFKVEWSMGYPIVAAGAIVIMGLRALLNWILLIMIFTIAQ